MNPMGFYAASRMKKRMSQGVLETCLTLATIMLLITACQSSNFGVSFNRSDCCSPDGADFSTYALLIENAPEFLKPYIEDAGVQVFKEKGLIRTDSGNDLLLIVTYEQTDLKEELKKDSFQGHLTPGGDFRFIAELKIEVKDVRNGATIWAGSISRDHDVFVGEYMHKSRANVAIYSALSDLFADFPVIAR